MPTLEELSSFAGVDFGASPSAQPQTETSLDQKVMEFAGLTAYEPPHLRPRYRGELTDAERQQIISTIEPRGWLATTAAHTTPGYLAEAINRATMPEGVPYEPLPQQNFGLVGNAASQLTSLAVDPLTLVSGGVGAKAGKALGEKLIEKKLAQEILTGSVAGATTLGTLTAVHDPLAQYGQNGEVDPKESAYAFLKSVALGTALGPAGAVPTRAGAAAAEIGTFAVGAPALEGRLPTWEDVFNAAAVIGGMKGAGAIVRKIQAFRTGRDEIVQDYNQRLEAGQADPTPSKEVFEKAGFENGGGTRKERAAIVEALKPGEVDLANNPPGGGGQVGDVLYPKGEPNAPEIRQVQENNPREYSDRNTRGETDQAGGGDRLQQGGNEPQAQGEVAPERQPTSIKNAVVDQERQARGLPPAMEPLRRSFEQVWDMAMEEPSTRTDALIAELKEKPRPISDLEDALLLHRQVSLQNEYDKVIGRMDEAKGDPVRTAELDAQEEVLSKQLVDLYDAGKAAGTETGRGLNARKMLANEDFSLAKMIVQKRKATGVEELTPEATAEVKAAYQKITELQKRLDEHVAQIEALKADKGIQVVETAVKKRQASRREAARAEVDAVWKELETKFAGKLFSNPLDPELIVAGAKLARAYIKLGVATVGDFMTELKKKIGDERVEKNRDIWEAAWKEASAKTKPTADRRDLRKSASVTRFAHDLAEFFVGQGVKEREALIDAVYEELAKAVPSITRRQAMDAISGYGQYKPLNKAQTATELRDLKGQMQQIGKLEDMAAGKAPVKTGIERRVPSDEERRLIQQVNEAKKKGGYVVTNPETQLKSALNAAETRLKNRIADLEAQIAKGERFVKKKVPVPTNDRIEALKERRDELQAQLDDLVGKQGQTDAQRLAAFKSRTRTRIAELEDRLARGDFAKVERKPLVLDQEAENIRFQLEKTKLDYLKGLEADRRAKRSTPQKIWEGGKEALNASRAILTSMDFSAVGRQGGILTAAHPQIARRAMGEMFRAFRSDADESRIMNEIANRPNAPLYRRAKLSLTGIHGRLSQMEEAYMSRWAKNIPGVAHSERAYVAFLNRIRADVFDSLIATLGKGGGVTEAEAKVIANYVNVATGRGDLGRFAAGAEGLATVFFAPRYVASRFQFLLGQPFWKGNVRTRLLIAKEYARSLTGLGMFYTTAGAALYALIGPPGEKEKWNIELDPRSSDFGKIRIGQTRIDPLAGLQQVTVLVSRLTSGETKKLTGKVVPIRGPKVPFGGSTSVDVMSSFLRSKLSPLLGLGADIVAGKDVVGQPVTPQTIAERMIVPISFQNIYDAMKAQGVPAGIAMSILDLFGISVNIYEKKKNAA